MATIKETQKNFTFNNQEIINILSKNKVKFAYIFGSKAKNRDNKASDLDIAVFLDDNNPIERFNKKLLLTSKLSSIYKKQVDIVILNDIKNELLLLDIITEGKVIIDQNPNLRFYFEYTSQHRSLDFLTHLEYAK